MGDSKDDDRDDDFFREIYGKEYTGPPRPAGDNSQHFNNLKKRSTNEEVSEEDNEAPDPNAVPTDFTSREAKVWEAKAKAIERNWKRRKEEELTCKICGDKGHFTQGCPQTLGGGGGGRKTSEIVEKVAIKDKRLRSKINSGSNIEGIEKDTGCHLKVEEGFVRVTGPDRAKVAMAVNAVKKLLNQSEDDWRQSTNSKRSHGSDSNPTTGPSSEMEHIATRRIPHMQSSSYSGKNEARPFNGERVEPNAPLPDAHRQWEIGSKQEAVPTPPYWQKGGWGAVGVPSSYGKASSVSEDETTHGYHGLDSRPLPIRGSPLDAKGLLEQETIGMMGPGYEQFMPRSLEALEERFMRETMELRKEQNEVEDRENARHRECMMEIQEEGQRRMAELRARQSERREEFLRYEAQARQTQYQRQSDVKSYDYSMSGAAASLGGGGVAHDRLGYGASPGEGHRGYGGTLGSSYNDDRQYYTSYAYDRGAPRYNNSNSMYPGNQDYDSGYYR